jgi:hypothetical protein
VATLAAATTAITVWAHMLMLPANDCAQMPTEQPFSS